MIHAIMALLLAGGEAPARFEADGLHLGPVVVADATLAMTADGRLLASRTQLESLGAPVAVALGHDRLLTVRPGLRVVRAEGGVVLRAHQGRRVALVVGGERLLLASPASVVATPRGLKVEGRVFDVQEAAAAVQDDADANLKKMQDAAKKNQETAPPPQPEPGSTAPAARRPGRFDWFRTFNPFAVSQPVSPAVVTSSHQLSNIGF